MRVVNVSAQIEKAFKPEIAQVCITVKGSGSNRQECMRVYNEAAKKLSDALAGQGFDIAQLKDEDMNVHEEKEWLYERQEGNYYRSKQVRIGFTCEAHKELTLDLAEGVLGKLWLVFDACDEDEASFRINYGLRDPKAAEAQLIADAVKAAKARALAMAQADDCALGDLQSVSYGDEPDFFAAKTRQSLMKGSIEAPDINPNDIEVSCEVRAQWELVNAEVKIG